MSIQAERLARVETEVQALKESFEEHKVSTEKKFTEINEKLDDLLELRNKGAGVFWLVSSLVGAGLIGGAVQFFKWVMGVHS